MSRSIPYLSTVASSNLWERLVQNLDRYFEGDFSQELDAAGAVMLLPIEGDVDLLKSLDADKSDVENAQIVWTALRGLTPALACENRIWTCLSHGEGLGYARARWLQGKTPADKKVNEHIGRHFFARTQTMYRDDNAISRLWWTAYVAWVADASDHAATLSLIFSKQDIRSNFVERTWMMTRPPVSRAVVRAMRSDPWVTAEEDNFRGTMKSLNIEGAGVSFEVLTEKQADAIVQSAVARAKELLASEGAGA